jgi:hypothetical protein
MDKIKELEKELKTTRESTARFNLEWVEKKDAAIVALTKMVIISHDAIDSALWEIKDASGDDVVVSILQDAMDQIKDGVPK